MFGLELANSIITTSCQQLDVADTTFSIYHTSKKQQCRGELACLGGIFILPRLLLAPDTDSQLLKRVDIQSQASTLLLLKSCHLH